MSIKGTFNDSFHNNISFGVENASKADVEAAARLPHEFIINTPEGYQTNVGDRGGNCRAVSDSGEYSVLFSKVTYSNSQRATSALDTESEMLVQSANQRLMKNRTTIVIHIDFPPLNKLMKFALCTKAK